MNLYQITTHYATFGLIEEDNKIVQVAPIAKWCLNKTCQDVIDYYKNKGANVCLVGKLQQSDAEANKLCVFILKII